MEWINYLTQFGYLGIFLLSLIGAISIIFPIPYTLSYYILGARLDPVFIAISGGTGSAIGEISGYLLGYWGHTLISDEKKRNMDYLIKIFNHYGPIVIFLFALTPLPDDLLFIPLGILRYSFIKAFIPCLLGKMVMAYILAYSGKVSFDVITIIFGEAGWFAIIIALILLAGSIIAMLKIDWEKIFKKYIEKR